MAPRADFLMPTASCISTTRSRTRDLGLSLKPDTSGRDSPPVDVIRTENFQFRENS